MKMASCCVRILPKMSPGSSPPLERLFGDKVCGALARAFAKIRP